jgi:hypothetical protein
VSAAVERVFCKLLRVLVDHGLLVLTVASGQFEEMLWFPKLLRSFEAPRLAKRPTFRGELSVHRGGGYRIPIV